MPKKSKTGGPAYIEPPLATYIVVVKPWSVASSPMTRKQVDYDRIATWVVYVLSEAANSDKPIPTAECVYRMRTRDEVIVQLPLGTSISFLLGQHYWADFVKGWQGSPSAQQATSVSEYNWRNNGDPANHNWEEFFPDIFPLDSVPIVSPYPPPSWVKVPVTLTSFVLPIPNLPIPSQHPKLQRSQITLKEEDKGVDVTKHTSSKTEMDERPSNSELQSLFKQYSPPSHHPSYVQVPTKSQGPKQSEQLKMLKKLDPYEIEGDAEQLVHSFKSEPGDEETCFKSNSDDIIKLEKTTMASDYQPSMELFTAFNSLNESMIVQTIQPLSNGLKREQSDDRVIEKGDKRVKLEES